MYSTASSIHVLTMTFTQFYNNVTLNFYFQRDFIIQYTLFNVASKSIFILLHYNQSIISLVFIKTWVVHLVLFSTYIFLITTILLPNPQRYIDNKHIVTQFVVKCRFAIKCRLNCCKTKPKLHDCNQNLIICRCFLVFSFFFTISQSCIMVFDGHVTEFDYTCFLLVI